MCYTLLHDQKFLGQILPRIPVLVMRDLEAKLEPYADAGRARAGKIEIGLIETGALEGARIVTGMITVGTLEMIAIDQDQGIVEIVEVADTLMKMTIGHRAVVAIAEAVAVMATVIAETITVAVVAVEALADVNDMS
ncbi:hypothetical protein BGZ80_009014 [Entomortierella chlamydospora]|uniref:Uncharacterized protein n=1 Tax=Entomortierella chlamydospora TaxID=101097 RepID=A0A9P6MWS6_9FUNG|nr:hypothetical protein BGZ80_009014 [Entomortierella chlamydospora]